jgi:GAF domain-containing protein
LIDQPAAESLDQRLVDIAAKVIGCPGTALLRVSRSGSVVGVAFHDAPFVEMARQISEVTAEGVVHEAVRHHALVVANDLRIETRWPAYTDKVLTTTTIRSVLALPLYAAGKMHAVLAFYSDQPEYFVEPLCELTAVFASHAADALAYRAACERAAHLDLALVTNRQIGSAMGILMERHGITDREAFEMLRDRSQHLNIKLQTIAQCLINSGQLPPRPPKAESSLVKAVVSSPEHRTAIAAMHAAESTRRTAS